MKYEDLMKLENGTLLKIKGKGILGETYKIIMLNKAYIIGEKRKPLYMLGGIAYPLEWLSLATEDDYYNAIIKASKDLERTLDNLKEAFEKTKKAGKKNEK